jgi:hypothetical protein
VRSLDDDFDRMHLESASFDEEVTDDEVDSNAWNEIESESDVEFLENHGLVKEVTPASEHNTIDPIDCYRHFITDEIIGFMVLEINDTRNNTCKPMRLADSQKFFNGNEPLIKRCSNFLGISIEMGLV